MNITDQLRGLAFHEAGHAVVAWSLNLRVHDIHIRDIGVGDSETKTDLADHLSLTDQLAICLAGEKAGKLFECPLPSWVSGKDREKVLILLLGLASREDEMQRVQGYARAHDLLVKHRDRTIRLATRLIEVRKADATEFLHLMVAA
jgi:ATP-dependent Zn protease